MRHILILFIAVVLAVSCGSPPEGGGDSTNGSNLHCDSRHQHSEFDAQCFDPDRPDTLEGENTLDHHMAEVYRHPYCLDDEGVGRKEKHVACEGDSVSQADLHWHCRKGDTFWEGDERFDDYEETCLWTLLPIEEHDLCTYEHVCVTECDFPEYVEGIHQYDWDYAYEHQCEQS